MANTQPFAGDGLIFVHNGYIEGFSRGIRARMRAEIDPAIEEDINGNTDSEYLFALLRSQPGSRRPHSAAAFRIPEISGSFRKCLENPHLLWLVLVPGRSEAANGSGKPSRFDPSNFQPLGPSQVRTVAIFVKRSRAFCMY